MKRDPKVFARNVRAFRALRRWGIRELAERAGVSTKTIVKIERGDGCSVRTELRIADGFGSFIGRLWDETLISEDSERVIRRGEGRWFFGSVEDATRYHERLAMSRPSSAEERLRGDPEEIQDEDERCRLGRAGLSRAFVKAMGGGLSTGYFKYNECEVYAPDYTPLDPFGYTYLGICVHGSVRFRIREKIFEMREGDTIVYEGTAGYWIEPSEPVTGLAKPPSVRFVCLGVLPLAKRTGE